MHSQPTFAALIILTTLPITLFAADPCHLDLDQSKPQFIVGYGSLMEQESKKRAAPNAGPSFPILITGYRRAWNSPGPETGFSTTFLGVEIAPPEKMVAAIFPLNDLADIQSLDAREHNYCREIVDPTAIKLLNASVLPPHCQIWIYTNKPTAIRTPSERFPIVQSYVDVFLNGCIQLSTHATAFDGDFTRACVESTTAWSKHWVNDRLYPRRPFIHEPHAPAIDKLLDGLVPEFRFARIE